MKVSWEIFKAFAIERGISMQYLDLGYCYWMKLFDEQFTIECIIDKVTEAELVQDFEINFKPDGNKKLTISKDSENSPIHRLKMAPTGWTYKLRGIEVVTSKNYVDSFDFEGNPRTDIVLRHFDINGMELSDTNTPPGTTHPEATMTYVEWEPPHDYEIIGGTIKILQQAVSDCRLWVVAVPDIPYIYGGSRTMVDGVNFKYISPSDKVDADGRVSKRLTYDPINHTNKLRFVFTHAPGAEHDFQIFLEFFKP